MIIARFLKSCVKLGALKVQPTVAPEPTVAPKSVASPDYVRPRLKYIDDGMIHINNEIAFLDEVCFFPEPMRTDILEFMEMNGDSGAIKQLERDRKPQTQTVSRWTPEYILSLRDDGSKRDFARSAVIDLITHYFPPKDDPKRFASAKNLLDWITYNDMGEIAYAYDKSKNKKELISDALQIMSWLKQYHHPLYSGFGGERQYAFVRSKIERIAGGEKIEEPQYPIVRVKKQRVARNPQFNGGIFIRSRDGWYSGYPQPQLYANPLDLEQQFNSKKFLMRCESEGVAVTEAREIILATPSEKLTASDRDRAISWLISKFIAGNVKLEDAGESSKITEYLDNFFKYKGRLAQKDLNQYSYPSEIFLAVKPLLGKAAKEFKVDPSRVANAEFFRKDENGEIWIPHTVEASCALGKGTEWCTAKYPPNDERNMFNAYDQDGDIYIFFDNRTGKRYQYHRESDQMMDEDDNECINAEFINLLGEVYDKKFTYMGDGNIVLISADGTQIWHKDGELHRDGDKPAFVSAEGTQIWYKEGKRHREGDKPAEICADGTQEWWKNGEPYREGDKPALISADGTQTWYKNGKIHRDGDKPAVILPDGTQIWYKDGKLHRDGDKPAVIRPSGRITQEWWKDGIRWRIWP